MRYPFFYTLMIILNMPVAAQLSYVAHRGASYLAPENTIASIQLAWDLNSDGAECDIMLSRDNKIVVFHDQTGQRLLNNDLKISEVPYAAIKNIPVKLRETNLKKYEGSTVPQLKDLLKTVPEGRLLVIEIKCGKEIIPFLEKTIKKYWKSGNITFIAFDYETIIEIKKIFPDFPCYYLSSNVEDVNLRFDEIARSNLEGVNLNHKIIDKTLVKRFHAVNKEVWCWTVNLPEDALRMQESGVKYITTDRPAWLKKELERR